VSTAPPAGSGGADAAPTGSGGADAAPTGSGGADAAPTGSGGPDAVLDGGLTGSWERLHPLSAVVRAGRGVLTIVIVIGLEAGRNGHDALTAVITVSVALVLGVITWLVTRWRVDDGVLQIETGLLRRQSLRFPLTQIQAVDVVRPGLARVLGMAELRVRMAGARGSSGWTRPPRPRPNACSTGSTPAGSWPRCWSAPRPCGWPAR
jgi:hypothetical protein